MAMCYVAMARCGRMVGAVVESSIDRSNVATCVGQWIRQGFVAERATDESVREEFKGCPHHGRKCEDCPEKDGMIPLPGLREPSQETEEGENGGDESGDTPA